MVDADYKIKTFEDRNGAKQVRHNLIHSKTSLLSLPADVRHMIMLGDNALYIMEVVLRNCANTSIHRGYFCSK